MEEGQKGASSPVSLSARPTRRGDGQRRPNSGGQSLAGSGDVDDESVGSGPPGPIPPRRRKPGAWRSSPHSSTWAGRSQRRRRALLGGGGGGAWERLGLGIPWTETTGEKGGGRTGGAGGIDKVLLTSRGRVERRPLARHGASAMEHSEGGERGKERIAKRPLELLN